MKEKEHMEKKRKTKEKEKKVNRIRTKFLKLVENFKDAKRKWCEEGTNDFENMRISKDIEKSISEIAKNNLKIFVKQQTKDPTKN